MFSRIDHVHPVLVRVFNDFVVEYSFPDHGSSSIFVFRISITHSNLRGLELARPEAVPFVADRPQVALDKQ